MTGSENPRKDVEEFLDLVENKYAIKIKLEANNVFGPTEVSRGLTYREKTLGAMFWKARELYRNDNSYYNDLRKIISSIKLQGFYEEADGLPKKYSECLDRYNTLLKNQEKMQKDFDKLSELYENLKTEKEDCERDKKALESALTNAKTGQTTNEK